MEAQQGGRRPLGQHCRASAMVQRLLLVLDWPGRIYKGEGRCVAEHQRRAPNAATQPGRWLSENWQRGRL